MTDTFPTEAKWLLFGAVCAVVVGLMIIGVLIGQFLF